MRLLLAVGLALLLATPALAGDPVTVTNSANTYQATVDASGLHVVCDSGCSGGSPTAVTIADGSDVAEGSTTQSVCAGDTTSGCSLEQRLQRLTAQLTSLLTTLNTNVTAPIPAGSALIGKTGIDQTTPGTTNGVQVNAALPAGANVIGKASIDQTTPGTTNNVTVSTNVGTLPLVQATASVAISIASGTTTQIIAASGSTVIRITQLTFVADATNTVTYESGDTGGGCANPVALSGAEAYAANGGEANNGLTFILPAGKAFCILTTAAGHGHAAYAQF